MRAMTRPPVLSEGSIVNDAGHLARTWYVDLGVEWLPSSAGEWPLCMPMLIKGCEKRHALEVCNTIRVSKPGSFRYEGETLISDMSEAIVSRETLIEERVDDPVDLARERLLDDESNRGSQLVGSTLRTTTNSVSKKRKTHDKVSSGRNGWIWCSSVEPDESGEWDRWHGSLKPSYDHISRIRSPRRFARALGLMVAQQLGPQGQTAEAQSRFRRRGDNACEPNGVPRSRRLCRRPLWVCDRSSH